MSGDHIILSLGFSSKERFKELESMESYGLKLHEAMGCMESYGLKLHEAMGCIANYETPCSCEENLNSSIVDVGWICTTSCKDGEDNS